MMLALAACQGDGTNPASPSATALGGLGQTASKSNDQSGGGGKGWKDGTPPGEGTTHNGIQEFTAMLRENAMDNGAAVGSGSLTLEPIARQVCYSADYDHDVYRGELQGEVHVPAGRFDLDGPLYPDSTLNTSGEVLMRPGQCIRLPAHTFTRLQQDLGRLPDGYALIVRFGDGQKIGGVFDR